MGKTSLTTQGALNLSVIDTGSGNYALKIVNPDGTTIGNFLGFYATENALTTAHPTASAGNYAIVGATDTVWIWDTDTVAWVDSGVNGAVTSVFSRTGIVTAQSNDY
ncbi:unnamed protein product, partial [marine sediment metagenome]